MQREEPIGVRQALPVEWVDIILGDDLAGSHVWARATSIDLSPLQGQNLLR